MKNKQNKQTAQQHNTKHKVRPVPDDRLVALALFQSVYAAHAPASSSICSHHHHHLFPYSSSSFISPPFFLSSFLLYIIIYSITQFFFFSNISIL